MSPIPLSAIPSAGGFFSNFNLAYFATEAPIDHATSNARTSASPSRLCFCAIPMPTSMTSGLRSQHTRAIDKVAVFINTYFSTFDKLSCNRISFPNNVLYRLFKSPGSLVTLEVNGDMYHSNPLTCGKFKYHCKKVNFL